MPFLVNGVNVDLKIDSGADANVISMQNYLAVSNGDIQLPAPAKTSSVQLMDFGGNEIRCAGHVTATIATSKTSQKLLEMFYVATSRPQSVLSFATATKLGVLTIKSTILEIKSSGSFPTMPIEPVRLRIDKEVAPRICIYNNIPAALEPFVNDHWDTLERQGVIEPVPDTPQWLSRVDVVPKKGGAHRIIIDMRPANKAIARKYYPMPNPDQLITKIRGAKYFAKLDMKSAYHHVMLHPDSRYVTAFMTNKGARQFTRLPFGINCAPEIFQQIMDHTFRGLQGVLVYLDDVLIYAPDKKSLEERRKAVMEIVRKNNLTLNQDKCVKEATTVEFLGSMLSENGCMPVPERIDGIGDFSTPRTYAELRQFIGLVNYIAKHLYDVSTTMEPMRRLLDGDARKLKGARLLEEWGAEQHQAFLATKRTVAENILERGYFDFGHLTKITTDASPVGIAAIITQTDPVTQNERVIACTSRSLTKTERKYPQTQREALAIVWSIDKFSYYLIGSHFTLVTDHEPMKFIFGNGARRMNKRAMTRAESWAMKLGQYEFDVEVIKSKDNVVDCLSRCPATHTRRALESTTPKCIQIAMVWTITTTPIDMIRRSASLTPEELKEATACDPRLQEVIQAVDGDRDWKTVAEFSRFQKELRHTDGIIWRGDRTVVPEKLRTKTMVVAHRSHPGMSTTKHLLRKYVWWPGMDRDVEGFIKACSICIKLSSSDPPEPLKMSNFPQGPWQDLAIDFWSGGDSDHKVLVIADYYSKAVRAELMRETTSEATIKALEKVFNEWGWPKSIKHDNGPQLISDEFRGWMISNDIKSLATTPRNAQENGLVERHMKGVTRAFAIAKLEKRQPGEILTQYVSDYNSWPHTVTQLAPRDVLMGRIVKTRFPLSESSMPYDFSDTARERDRKFKTKKKTDEDKKRRAKISDVKVGDIVYIRNHDRRSKTDPNFLSAKHEVTARSGGRLTLQSLKDNSRKLRKTIDVKKVPENEHDGLGAPSTEQQNGPGMATNQVPATTMVVQPTTASLKAQLGTTRPQRERRPPKQFSLLEMTEQTGNSQTDN